MDQHLTIGFPVLFNIKQAIESGKQNEDSSFNAVLISGILNTGIEMVEGNYLQRTFIWKKVCVHGMFCSSQNGCTSLRCSCFCPELDHVSC